MVAPPAYRSLLTPVAAAGVRIVVPMLTRRGPAALAGMVPPQHEAARLASVIAELRRSYATLSVGGHSRGGLVAWLASAAVDPDGLVLVDPVSGGGPPWARAAALTARRFRTPPVVIGLGAGGRCAPVDRGHRVFSDAAPGCLHVVIPHASHADVLDGRSARLYGLLCSPGADPAATRRAVTELLITSVLGAGSANSGA